MEQIYNLLIILIFIEVSTLIAFNFYKIKRKSSSPLFIDTSALIDGRLLSLVDAGLLSNDLLIVPASVVRELQQLADGIDSEKRLKARAGLDVILKLKSDENINIKTYDYKNTKNLNVDDQLIKLCKDNKGILLTVDYNLLKVAQVENIHCININELAKNLRLAYLPGDKFEVVLTQRGNESKQAVGYLDDGTMVVVDNSRHLIGNKVQLECTRTLQTVAGRMMFAKLIHNSIKKD